MDDDDDLDDDLDPEAVAALLAAARDPAGLAEALAAAGFGHLLVPVTMADLPPVLPSDLRLDD